MPLTPKQSSFTTAAMLAVAALLFAWTLGSSGSGATLRVHAATLMFDGNVPTTTISTSSVTTSTATTSTTTSSTSTSSTTTTSLDTTTSSSAPSTTAPTTTSVATTVATTSVPQTTASTTSTTVSSTTASTIAPAGARQELRLFHMGLLNTGGMELTGNAVAVYASGSVLDHFNASFKAGVANVSFTVINSSAVPSSLPAPAVNVYQYIQINGSANGGADNIDAYVQNVTYNFTVPIGWVLSSKAAVGAVKLYKYLPQSGTWQALPTAFGGGNETDYVFSAVSNSFSGYVVGIATNSGSSATGTISTTVTSGYNTYFYVGAGAEKGSAANGYTTNYITNSISAVNHGGGPSSRLENATIIGVNGTSGTGNIGTIAIATGTTFALAIGGIGTNVIFTSNGVNGGLYTANGLLTTTTAATLSFPVDASNSIVYILMGSGGTLISSPSMPAGCTTDQTKSQGVATLGSEVIVANCVIAATGTKTASFTVAAAKANFGTWAIAAYVFPPYGVTLNDNPSGGGTITTNGSVQANGNTILAIGSSTITANPGGAYSFNSWIVDTFNSANIILGSTTSSSTSITVMGNAIITATYNALPITGPLSVTDTLNSGFSTYFWGSGYAAQGAGLSSTTYTANFPINSVKEASSASSYANISIIGINGATNPGNVGNVMAPSVAGAANFNGVIAGIGANVIFTSNGANGGFYTANGLLTSTTAATLSFPVDVANSLAYIIMDSGGTNSMTANTLPAGCTIYQDKFLGIATLGAEAMSANCIIATSGTKTASFTVSAAKANTGTWAIGAAVFPPYGVILNDNPGSGGTITAQGTVQTNGNTIQIIGDNTFTANPASGYAFTGWSVDSANSANVVFANSGSQTTLVSAMGNAIITAAYTPTGVTYLPGYTLGFTTGHATPVSYPVSLTLASGYPTYFWDVADNAWGGLGIGSAYTVNFPINSIATQAVASSYINVSVIGINGAANPSRYGYYAARTPVKNNGGMSGLGANVIFASNGMNGAFYTANGVLSTTTSASLTFPVDEVNSIVYIFSSAGQVMTANTYPTGCSAPTAEATKSGSGQTDTVISNCIISSPGSQSVSFTVSGIGSGLNTWAIGAAVFPPYNVILDDNPTTGTVTTAGATVASGNIIKVIGINTITANPPSGYTFNSWLVDTTNSANVIIGNTALQTTYLQVMGEAIITATYNRIPVQFPLPNIVQWQVGGNHVSSNNKVSLALADGFRTYFWGSDILDVASTSSAYTTNFPINSVKSTFLSGAYTNLSVIGINGAVTPSNVGTVSAGNAGSFGISTIVGLGANVIFTSNGVNGAFYTANGVETTSPSLSFPVDVVNSVVFIFSTTTSQNANPLTEPAGCSTARHETQLGGGYDAYVANCIIPSTGTQTASFTISPAYAAGAWAIGAAVFPPYNVVLKDNPSTGNIMAGTITELSGNVITMIGTGTFTANPPSGYSFNSWLVDSANTANILVASSSANPTSISIMGEAIITATYTAGAATCVPVITNTLITFPSSTAGSFASTANAEKVTNAGTGSSNILVFGTNWISPSAAFHVSNTLWNAVTGGNIGTELTNTAVDTLIPVGAGNSNTIFFGLNIPKGQAAATYNQVITIETSC